MLGRLLFFMNRLMQFTVNVLFDESFDSVFNEFGLGLIGSSLDLE